MSQEQFDGPQAFSRRTLSLILSSVSRSETSGLLQPSVGGSSAAHNRPGAVAHPPAGRPGVDGRAGDHPRTPPLKGIKLTIIGGNSYVPAKGELDDLVQADSKEHGQDARAGATPTRRWTQRWRRSSKAVAPKAAGPARHDTHLTEQVLGRPGIARNSTPRGGC